MQSLDPVAYQDLAYQFPWQPETLLDIYTLKNNVNDTETPPKPLLVLIHGGHWSCGDKLEFASIAKKLTKSFVVACVNYPLNVPCALQLASLADAFEWLTQDSKASFYGYNSKQLYVFAHDSGAHLTSLLLLQPKWFHETGPQGHLISSRISQVILANGIYDLPAHHSSYPHKCQNFNKWFGPQQDWFNYSPRHLHTTQLPPISILTTSSACQAFAQHLSTMTTVETKRTFNEPYTRKYYHEILLHLTTLKQPILNIKKLKRNDSDVTLYETFPKRTDSTDSFKTLTKKSFFSTLRKTVK